MAQTEVDLKIVSKDYREEEESCFSFSLELSLISLKTRPEIEKMIAPKKKETVAKKEGGMILGLVMGIRE